MRINKLPVRTWNRLKMNDTVIEIALSPVAALYTEELPEGTERISGRATGSLTDIPVSTGLGEEFDDFVEATGIKTVGYVTPDGVRADKPLYIGYGVRPEDGGYKAGDRVSRLDFTIGAGSALTVIEDIADTGEEDGTFVLQNKYHIAADGELTLIQVNRLSARTGLYNDIGGYVADGGNFRLIQVVLGGGMNYYGSYTKLSGRGSSLSAGVAYTLNGEATLDMNYIADHTGKGTVSDINVSGVMKGRARKLFRGTIDFHRGCAGAKGAELEDVLLIDDTIVNQTIPLILCDEEDVEGAHGATIGRLDESLLTYMKSRGIDERTAYRLMERAKIDAIASGIEDERTKELIASSLGEEDDD